MTVRSLPIRVDPVAGEGILSWMRMLAHRNEVTWTEMVRAVGLHRRRGDGRRTRWSQRLHDHEITVLSQATAVEPATLHAMTLAVFDGIGITTGRRPSSPDYGALHGLRSRSRYCPRCLDDSGGRWQLRWLLGYTFVCTVHHTVLADTCPGCGQPPHPRQPTALAIPQPLRCEHRIRRDGRIGTCGTDLRPGAHLRDSVATPPMMAAQRVIDTIIDNRQADFGVYETTQVSAASALSDVRALATRLQRCGDLIADVAGPPPATADGDPVGPARTGASASQTAVAITAAVAVLSAADAATAGQRLRPFIAATRADGRTASASSLIFSRRRTSSTLTRVQLHALAPWLTPTDLLRYRIALDPDVPHRPAATLARSIRAVPPLLWPALALRLHSRGLDFRAVQAALSVSVALVGTRESLAPIVTLLGNVITARAVSHVWARLRSTGDWDVIQHAVIRIADHLQRQRTPIDYQRRRTLDYTDLLSDTRWQRICRTTDSLLAQAADVGIARTVLFTRISGCPADHSPWFAPSMERRGRLAHFTRHTTPLLRRQLDDVAEEFLARQRIIEPLTWIPPASLLDGLQLPGAHLNTVDGDQLHRLFGAPEATITTAARQLDVSPELVHYLVDSNPCPPPTTPTPPEPMRRVHARTPDAQTRTYQDQTDRPPVAARRHDRSAQTPTGTARTPGGDARSQRRAPRSRPDREWLAQHYLTERRTVPEIAQIAGVSASTVRRWMSHYAIATRPRGTASHRSAGAAHRMAGAQPALLRPALRDPGGPQRLHRFAVAMHYPTLAAAAHALNTSQPVLTQQFDRLESQFGQPLYHRAKRAKPMQPTEFGRRVVIAVHREHRRSSRQ